jgi:ribosomal protein S18 acetylase RimI-like enzyme
MTIEPDWVIVDLDTSGRERAVPVIIDSFEGIYRWHAKRTLHRIPIVRGAVAGDNIVGVSMLERLTPEVGYVYYLAVRKAYRKRGLGHALLDDALTLFQRTGATIAYAAAEEDNAPSLALFRSRGFRLIARDELNYQYGGLGAWGLRSRMMLVSGEVLLGRRLESEEPTGGPPESSHPNSGPTPDTRRGL